jgi:hypothetical protein
MGAEMTYTTYREPSLKLVRLQVGKLLVQGDVRFVHRHDFKGGRVEKHESIVQMSQTFGVDLIRSDPITRSFTRVPSLESTC